MKQLVKENNKGPKSIHHRQSKAFFSYIDKLIDLLFIGIVLNIEQAVYNSELKQKRWYVPMSFFKKFFDRAQKD